MIIPEIILYKFIKNCLELVRLDHNANIADPTKSILYKLFKNDDNSDPIILEKYDYYNQVVSLLTRTVEHQRYLDVFFGYNLERASLPTIHIMLPSENKGRYDSIGDQSTSGNVYNQTDQIVTVTKETTYSPIFSLLLTSDNSSEVLLIYYFLRAMFIIFKEHLEFKGIRNIKISGNDIILQQELTPPNIFHRSMNLDFDYAIKLQVDIPAEISGNIGFIICAEIGDEFNNYIQSLG